MLCGSVPAAKNLFLMSLLRVRHGIAAWADRRSRGSAIDSDPSFSGQQKVRAEEGEREKNIESNGGEKVTQLQA